MGSDIGRNRSRSRRSRSRTESQRHVTTPQGESLVCHSDGQEMTMGVRDWACSNRISEDTLHAFSDAARDDHGSTRLGMQQQQLPLRQLLIPQDLSPVQRTISAGSACSPVAAFFTSLSPPSIQIQVLYDDIPGGGKGRATSTGQAHSQNRETRRSVTYKLFLAATWFQSEAGRGELLGMCQYRSHQDFSEACARNFIICWEHYSTFWCNWRHYSY